MSLASYQAPAGGVPFQMAPAANMGMGGPSMGPGPSGPSSGGAALPQAIGPAQGGDSRGELSGDYCTAVDLFAQGGLQAAIWGEAKADCSLLGAGLPVVGCSEEGLRLLGESGVAVAELLLSAELCVGSSSTSTRAGIDCYPLRSLADQTLTNAHAPSLTANISKDILMPADHSGAPLPLLLGLLLAAATQAAADKGSRMFPSEAKAKKGKKVRKAKQTLTLVVPCGMDQKQLAVLAGAAECAGLTIRNVFGRGVAAVTGALFRSAGYRYGEGKEGKGGGKGAGVVDLFSALKGHVTAKTGTGTGKGAGTGEPFALYLNLYRLEG
ncbi:hypothetical protein B484DRAFT_192540, partial [Ochromonadaceae sp. CCMP2298]